MKTPGVYIVEKSAFPNSVVQVPTAVPVFIGHTARAENGGKTLLNKPWKITSMAEYINFFGGSPKPEFSIASAKDAPATTKFSIDNYKITQSNIKYNLYYNMLLFYQNGGGPCYII